MSTEPEVLQRFWGAVVFFPGDEAVEFTVEGTADVHISGSAALYGGALVVESESEDADSEAPEGKPADIPIALPARGEGKEAGKAGKAGKEAAAAAAEPKLSATEKLKRQKAAAAEAHAGEKRRAAESKDDAEGADEGDAEAAGAKSTKQARRDTAAGAASAEATKAEKPAKAAKAAAKAEEKPAADGMRPLAGGKVQYKDDVVGTGAGVTPGHKVTVRYVGRLANGKVFDKSDKFEFRHGVGSVISGWDVGLASMRVGGKRRLVIHPSYGYGPQGAPPAIPPNATLIFDVELVGTK